MTHFYPSQVISCDQNLNRCCELIELTAKIQGQLFSILNLTAAEGKLYICSAGLGFHLQSLNQAVITHVSRAIQHTLRWTLCWSGHPQNAPAAVAWNLLLNGEALGH